MFHFLLQSATFKKVDYEDMIHAIQNPSAFLIVNTLPIGEQSVLIKGTLPYIDEESTINGILANYTMDQISIVVYGKNANDENAEKKCRQIQKLGFRHVFLYGGGLFEWLLLRDIFGDVNFPTIGKPDNFLKYKAPSTISRVVYKSIKY